MSLDPVVSRGENEKGDVAALAQMRKDEGKEYELNQRCEIGGKEMVAELDGVGSLLKHEMAG